MRNHWPEDEIMAVLCPNCNRKLNVQISVVRELDDPLRPDDCQHCHAEFHLFADGTTELLSAPPKKTTTHGHVLKKQFQDYVFDPNG